MVADKYITATPTLIRSFEKLKPLRFTFCFRRRAPEKVK